MKSPLKWHNLPGEKNTGLVESLFVALQLGTSVFRSARAVVTLVTFFKIRCKSVAVIDFITCPFPESIQNITSLYSQGQ